MLPAGRVTTATKLSLRTMAYQSLGKKKGVLSSLGKIGHNLFIIIKKIWIITMAV